MRAIQSPLSTNETLLQTLQQSGYLRHGYVDDDGTLVLGDSDAYVGFQPVEDATDAISSAHLGDPLLVVDILTRSGNVRQVRGAVGVKFEGDWVCIFGAEEFWAKRENVIAIRHVARRHSE